VRTPQADPASTASSGDPIPDVQSVAAADVKTAFLEEIRRVKKFFHGSVVSMAQRIAVEGDRIVFTFAPIHRVLRGQLDQQRPWLETLATQLAGRKMTVASAEGAGAPAAAKPAPGQARAGAPPSDGGDRQAELRQQAMADSGVQTMLDVFGGEIKEIEEM
jgi:hypothetical protein